MPMFYLNVMGRKPSTVYVAAIDMDGTIIDSKNESFYLTEECFEDVFGYAFPYKDNPEGFRNDVRFKIEKRGDLFTITHALHEGIEYSNVRELREIFPEEYKKGDELMVYTRKDMMKNNPKKLLSMSHVFKGMDDVIKSLDAHGQVKHGVATNKPTEVAEFYMHNLNLPSDFIVGSETQDGRKGQLIHISNSFTGMKNITLYDDLRHNLLIAQELGAHPVAATHGYGTPEEIKDFEQASPEEFLEVFSQHHGIKL
jgi:phosphoglycolate phosphatase-like HAD superfamily hydrolase